MEIVTTTAIKELPLLSRGKVRDIYELDETSLLIVTTDRMSAFDVIMNEPIPYKGVVLNQITLFWLNMFRDIVPNHLIADSSNLPASLKQHQNLLDGRSVIVKKASPLPVECIVRGYLSGSGWKDYQKTGMVCGHQLPAKMQESDQLPQAIFTPSTKAELGEHDENISIAQAAQKIGAGIAQKVEGLSLSLYGKARDYAKERGIIIADTKFEFGMVEDELTLIDEVLTPDSSRFWPMQGYTAGKSQPSFDKQYLRDWLSDSGWNKTPPPPTLPKNVIDQTAQKYFEAYRLLTGKELIIK